jgi:hypothetical protein
LPVLLARPKPVLSVEQGVINIEIELLKIMPRHVRTVGTDLVSEEKTKCLGVVTASDEEIAISRVCEKFDIVDPEQQIQLTAREI